METLHRSVSLYACSSGDDYVSFVSFLSRAAGDFFCGAHGSNRLKCDFVFASWLVSLSPRSRLWASVLVRERRRCSSERSETRHHPITIDVTQKKPLFSDRPVHSTVPTVHTSYVLLTDDSTLYPRRVVRSSRKNN